MNREDIFRVTINKSLKPVARFMEDPSVSEIMINGPREVYVERQGLLEKSDAYFVSEEALLTAARNIAQYTNKRITPLTASLDSRLPDGSRVHLVFPRCSRAGLCIAIRRFSERSFTLESLVECRSLTPEAKEYLEIVVEMQKNLIVSGGTGSGKTTLLNAISGKIPQTERIIVIEDSSELRLQQPHVLSFEVAAADRHGRGAVSIRDLFRSSLRMRPDRIVIGECRGGEALDLIQAMTSGHGGSMSSLHANSCADALNRLETMCMQSGLEMPLFALRAQIASAIQVVVQMNRLSDGRRMVTEISESGPLSSSGQYEINRLFELANPSGQETEPQSPAYTLRRTGKTSHFGDDLRCKGLSHKPRLTRAIFGE